MWPLPVRELGDWDAETRVFIEAAAERLALALDNTRLLVQTRRQAFYQEQLGRLDDVVWRNPSTAAIMEGSVQELGRVLDASEVQVYLTPMVWEAQ
jgi:GAF domain-containing protein